MFMNRNFDQIRNTNAESDADIRPPMIFGFDRVELWLDQPQMPISLKRLKKHCTDATAIVQQMPFNARWKLKLELFQPTSRCLRLLEQALGHNIAAVLTYVEIACDTPPATNAITQRRCDAFLAFARVRYQRNPFKPLYSTWYCGLGDGKDRPANVLTVYADRPSKINNARPDDDDPPCLHIEWRATGSDALAQLGIVTLADLIHFDYQQFWDKHISIYRLPKPTNLGRLLAKASGADTNVSGSALRKRAASWITRHSHEYSKFIMHNALRDIPDIARRRLETVPFLGWLNAMLSAEHAD
jgi:hypothetical protein